MIIEQLQYQVDKFVKDKEWTNEEKEQIIKQLQKLRKEKYNKNIELGEEFEKLKKKWVKWKEIQHILKKLLDNVEEYYLVQNMLLSIISL